jgi:CheY-like chemotaxis protein
VTDGPFCKNRRDLSGQAFTQVAEMMTKAPREAFSLRSGPVVLDPDDLMPNRSRPGGRVLVVDDCPDSAEGMARLLGLYGYAVDVALDGKTALQQARAKQPDVVLLDICLPGMDGYEVARQLRAMFQNQVRLVAITAHGFEEEDRKRCLEAGFDVYLVKPVVIRPWPWA